MEQATSDGIVGNRSPAATHGPSSREQEAVIFVIRGNPAKEKGVWQIGLSERTQDRESQKPSSLQKEPHGARSLAYCRWVVSQRSFLERKKGALCGQWTDEKYIGSWGKGGKSNSPGGGTHPNVNPIRGTHSKRPKEFEFEGNNYVFCSGI